MLLLLLFNFLVLCISALPVNRAASLLAVAASCSAGASAYTIHDYVSGCLKEYLPARSTGVLREPIDPEPAAIEWKRKKKRKEKANGHTRNPDQNILTRYPLGGNYPDASDLLDFANAIISLGSEVVEKQQGPNKLITQGHFYYCSLL
jgi:hypothetical protein